MVFWSLRRFFPVKQLKERRVPVGNKLYVGNVPWAATEEEIRKVFGEIGAVNEVNIVMDRDSGRPKGFVFVTMADETAAAVAIEKLNGKEMGGRMLKIDYARERTPGAPRERRDYGGGGGGYGGGYSDRGNRRDRRDSRDFRRDRSY